MVALEWYYLVFELPFVGALLYSLLLATGAVHASAGIDLDGDGIPDIPSHFLDPLAGDSDHTLGTYHAGPAENALQFLGIGRVPLSIVATSWCFLWGFLGYASNQLLGSVFPPTLYFAVSLLTAGIGATWLTRYLALGLARVPPRTESYAVSREDLVGASGIARYEVNEGAGMVQVRDRHGNLHEVAGHARAGDGPIAAGSKVLLIDYDGQKGGFIVVRLSDFDERLA